ncbi:MAG: VOC family protein, partial [Verrucomicrobiia bacterium]
RLTDLLPAPPGEQERFGQPVLVCQDPDGIIVELVESESALTLIWWTTVFVPEQHALGPFHSVTLCVRPTEPTRDVLVEIVGVEQLAEESQWVRYHFPHFPHGGFIDLWSPEKATRGAAGAGSIHHVAWRVADDDIHAATKKAVTDRGLQVSPIIDRKYFHSIYFREPGGVLFEVATDAPGFLVDESEADLGTKLMLPEWYESMRNEIEAQLPALP